MAKKKFIGKVVSTKMQGSVVVEVVRKTPHALYRKLITKSKKYTARKGSVELVVGDMVSLSETRKTAGKTYFAVEGKIQ